MTEGGAGGEQPYGGGCQSARARLGSAIRCPGNGSGRGRREGGMRDESSRGNGGAVLLKKRNERK